MLREKKHTKFPHNSVNLWLSIKWVKIISNDQLKPLNDDIGINYWNSMPSSRAPMQ